MDEARRGALRLLASVRGRFNGMRDDMKNQKDMCEVARKALAANVAELKASASRVEGDARHAARDARRAATTLQDFLQQALSDLDVANKKSAAQQKIASDVAERLIIANAAINTLVNKNTACNSPCNTLYLCNSNR
eukprot:4054531-Pleurochrysis_carterae.AAC.1